MLNKSIARRYAEAFFFIAQEKHDVEGLQKELALVVETIKSFPELKAVLDHVLIPPAEKREVLAKVLGGSVSGTTLNFLSLVIDKRRAPYLEAIYEEYMNMADEDRNILKADFISARPVANQDIIELEKALSSATGKSVRLKPAVDSALIGGVRIRVGDRVIDASVVKRLELLRSSLKNVKIS